MENDAAKKIFRIYTEKRKLSEKCREVLVTEIVNFFIHNENHLSKSEVRNISEEIIQNFPSEDIVS